MAAPESTTIIEATTPAQAIPTDRTVQHGSAAASRANPFVPVPVRERRHNLAVNGLKNSPPWLISAILHMILMIALALLFLPTILNDQVDLQAAFADTLDEQDLIDASLVNRFKVDTNKPVLTREDVPQVPEPLAFPRNIDVELPGFDGSNDRVAAMVGVAYEGRRPGMREALLAAYGANAQTRQAVSTGLEWLARNQQKDGSWSLRGPYSGGGSRENREAATALALLAFQGDGNTAEYGQYQEAVQRGWYYLLKQQDGKGCFYREHVRIHHMYTQGLATIAICEHYAMLSSPLLKADYREPAAKSVEYCVKGQSSNGGWRYQPRTDSDLSVTGWIVMALQSARMAGLDVPKTTLDQASDYLDSVQEPSGSRYCYQQGSPPSCAMTAEGLLCRQYLGWDRNNPSLLEGVQWLLLPENELSYTRNRDVYHWYYATQVMHHMEGEPWEKWNRKMRELVPQAQVREGREAGSWDPQKPTADGRAGDGGRLYVTCLSLYMLQVYYRHLPLYSNPFVHVQ